MKPGFLLMIGVFLLVSGCAQLTAKNQESQLENAVTQYGAALRWGRVNEAYAFHRKRDGQQPQADLTVFDHIGVTDFIPINSIIEPDSNAATITVEIDYFDKEYGNIKKIKETELWWFDKDKKIWLIESDFPKFP